MTLTVPRNLLTKRALLFCCLAAASALVLVQPTVSATVYSIESLGLIDSEHTRNDGYQRNSVWELNEAGQARGASERYNGGSTDLGESAWLYSGATTINVGLIGPEHTRNDGYKYSYAYHLNEAGQAGGIADRYNGGSDDLGNSAWFYDGTNTINVGLSGPEHTRSDGYKNSVADGLNDAGQIIGLSDRFTGGGTGMGVSAWFYDGATTIDIGLTGAEHTRNDGYKLSGDRELNEAGQAIGYSRRYNGGSADLGQTAWFYDGVTTIDISFTDSEHTRSDGYRYSQGNYLNEAGQVAGFSARYNGGSDSDQTAWLYDGANTVKIGLTGYGINEALRMNEAGQVAGYASRFNGTGLGTSAWLYDGATSVEIGLTGDEHTSSSGAKYSLVDELNEAGMASGISHRYSGNTDLGQTAWLYDGATTIAVGLIDHEHTRNDGYRNSNSLSIIFDGELNDAGQVIGTSQRYNGGSADLGLTAWLYDGAVTTAIGLAGSEHTRNDGYKSSLATRLNEAGQVTGFSRRYNGGSTEVGQDAWFYDPVSEQTIALQFSTRTDGYAFSQVVYLGEDGLALGTYDSYDAVGNFLGKRAFYFTLADGLRDLGSLVDGGLAANGWDSLAVAYGANGLGQIVGDGKLASQSDGQVPYLLTPVVPEPSSDVLVVLLALMAEFLVPRQRN
jgi:hypothetical protein